MTADPLHPGTAYQVWDRIHQVTTGTSKIYDGPSYLSITRDGGRTWSKASPFVDASSVPNSQTIGNVVVVDPRDGTLYDFFEWQTYSDVTATTATDLHFAVVRSHDQGRTWSKPTTIATDTSVPEVHPNAPADPTKALRAGANLISAAIDPTTGELYAAYEGSEFTGGQYDGIELVHATDGGHTWSGPSRINQAPNAPAFTPSLAVDASGTVSLTYYDLRYLTPGKHHHAAHRGLAGELPTRRRGVPRRTPHQQRLRLAAGTVRRVGALPRRLRGTDHRTGLGPAHPRRGKRQPATRLHRRLQRPPPAAHRSHHPRPGGHPAHSGTAPHPRTPHASLTVRLVPPVAYAPGPWGARHPSKCRHKLVRWGW
ncbi:sialidase family protein [Streptomyces violascens]|uniref:hypothetical protein n=1 Tax=Streptomyces violascens TaxID=67381 RepID=UPI0036CC7460